MLEKMTDRNMAQPQNASQRERTAPHIGSEKKGHLVVAEFREETRRGRPRRMSGM
ncbi:hypothetical protein ACFOYU_12655 [Microvirga sp. GCM10011540]|uniref:hypothetical protein n=1 Tax=Microvirga sp. GCM10011540 TaxID=3317338 RepID=UPI00361949C8